MAELAKHIKEVLRKKECVIIPGLGGFVAAKGSARIDKQKGRILPPGKYIAFNSELTKDDGILAQHIAEKNDSSLHKARQIIKEEAEKLRKELDSNKKVAFDGVGELVLVNGKFHFKPNEDLSSELNIPGFEPVQAKKLRNAPVSHQNVSHNRKKNRALTPMFVIIPLLLIAGGAGFWFFSPLNEQQAFNLSGFFSENTEQTALQAEQEESQNESASAATFNQSIFGRSSVDQNTEKSVSVSSFNDKSYHIITGAFGDIDNANSVKDFYLNEGFDPQILETDRDFVRVSVKAFDNEEQAEQELSVIKNNYNSDAWILSQ